MSTPSGTFTPQDQSLFFDDNPNQTQEISRIGREQNVDKEMVGLVISKSSRNKQKKLRSDVWEKFKKRKGEDGNDEAICNLCGKRFDGSSKKGTTHLRNHFNRCPKKRNGGGARGSGDKPAGNSVTDQQVWENDIILAFNSVKEKLCIYFETLCCRFSLSIKNVEDGKYTGFVVHFIDYDWKLKEEIIGFKCIEGDQNMKVLKNVLLDLGIDNKISSMVTDGDSDIYVPSSDERENRLSGQGSLLSNCKFCLKDFYYVYHTCTHFEAEMRSVLLDHTRTILNYIIETSSKIGTFQMALGKEVTITEFEAEMRSVLLDHTRTILNYIIESSSKIETFQMALGKEVTITEEMSEVMDCSELLEIALGLKEKNFELENMKEQWDVVTKFVQFYDEDNDFDKIDWDLLKRETANKYFPILCRMYKKSRVFVTSCNSFNCGKIYLQFVRDAEKCWEQSNLILAVAAVLDPRFKLDTVEHWYKKIYGDECETQRATFMNYLISVYDEYANGTNNSQSSTSGSKEKKSSISYRMLDISGNSYDPDSGQSNNFELDLYLNHVNFPPIEEFDILEWWRGNSQYFPTLAKMARDFLSIKITVPSTVFGSLSYHGIFDSDIVKEAVVCTRSWLTNEESDEESDEESE